ncbi:hypothetical protein, partial [Xanthomonas vasicola]|uniref:hypothetical protein n=1 Tax=Xanthomonas vasicola TaxID=56459 RepID=UPI001E554486
RFYDTPVPGRRHAARTGDRTAIDHHRRRRKAATGLALQSIAWRWPCLRAAGAIRVKPARPPNLPARCRQRFNILEKSQSIQ